MLKPTLGSQLQLGHPLARGLAGLWLLNEGAGEKGFDLSGNNNTGVLTGGDVTWTAGKLGPALNFPGTVGDYVNISSVSVAAGITYNIWFIPRGTVIAGLISNRKTLLTNDSDLGFRWYSDIGEVYKIYNVVLTPGQLYHVAVTQVGTNYAIYLDGVCVVSGNDAVALNDTDTNHYIGHYTTVTWPFDGVIEMAMIHNRALNASENAQLDREPSCMFERDLIELWSAATQGGAPPAGIPIFRRRIEAA